MIDKRLNDEEIRLREFQMEDWRAVHDYASRKEASLFQNRGPNTQEESQQYVEQILNDRYQKYRYRYTLAIIKEETLVGAVELTIQSLGNRTGEIGYIVHPDYWGQGIATSAGRLILKFGFEQGNLHRIFATCDPDNLASAKVLEKIGMQKEGLMRENLKLESGWRNSLLYSILEQEF